MLNCRHSRIVTSPIATQSLLLAGTVLAVVLAGCTVNHAPRFHYGPDGEKIQFKRYEDHIALDFYHNQNPIIYTRTDALPLTPILSEEQQALLEAKGKPDYVREDYASDTKERVTDWVYYDHNVLYQFVEGGVVFEGPVTDYEKVLIRRGRPTEATTPTNQTGRRTDVLLYRKAFSDQLDQYVFSNGRLAGSLVN